MKIAVSSTGTSLESEVDPQFGRTAGFVLHDTDSDDISYLDNSTHRELYQSTGVKTAQVVIEAGADVLITGQIGPKAARVLELAKVKMYICKQGSVQDSIRSFERNQLKEFTQDDLRPGPGKKGGRGGGGRGRAVTE